MFYRLSQLKEIRHELGRARAIAEELGLLHLSNTLTHNLGTINAEILQLEKSLEPKPVAKEAVKRRTTKQPVINDSQEGNI